MCTFICSEIKPDQDNKVTRNAFAITYYRKLDESIIYKNLAMIRKK